MFKLIGALLVIGTTTWFGFDFAQHLSRRPKQLRLFRDSLQTLDAEIMYSHTPLQEAAKKISVQMPEPLKSFYSLFAAQLSNPGICVRTAWEGSLQKIWNHTDLKQNEYEILVQFGENLGKHDKYTQQKQIMLALTHLEREETVAREKQQQYEKLVKSLGFLSGLLFIILLL